MDKPDFVKAAPVYYMLAIVQYVRKTTGHISEIDLYSEYTDGESVDGPEYCYIEKSALLKKAIRTLVAEGALEEVTDDFGPHLYTQGGRFEAYVDLMESDPSSPFYKAKQTNNRMHWLTRALNSVNRAYDELGVRDTDIENPEADWSPIPLDQSDPKLKEVLVAVDDVLVKVEGDNGYAAQHPEERNFVVANLKLFTSTIRGASSTSIAFIKVHGLEPLMKLSKVFGKAALGKLIDAAIAALLAYFGL